MPYIYSLAGQVTQDGSTIMRPLVMDFQNDPRVYPITDEYMFGPSLLVAPVTTAGAVSRPVYLPHGLWYDFWTGLRSREARPSWPRRPTTTSRSTCGPAVIPLGPKDAQYAAQAVNPTEIRVYPGAGGQSALYSDSGDGYGYEHGAYERIPLSYHAGSGTLVIGREQGSYPGMPADPAAAGSDRGARLRRGPGRNTRRTGR